MANYLKNFKPGEAIKSSDTNDNNEFLLDKIQDNIEVLLDKIANVQANLLSQIATLKLQTFSIGQPIFRLSNDLYAGEIRLEGGEVSKSAYPQLYKIYGNTYGKPLNADNFVLPDFRKRTIYGAEDFGYLEAGLPNIKAVFSGHSIASGACKITGASEWHGNRNNNGDKHTITFDASTYNSIYKDDINTVQAPSVKVRVVTRYE